MLTEYLLTALVTERFDAIIVGAGQAGPPLAGRLTAAGQRVAMVERKLIGGTCVNNGCIPTKTLVASAHAAHLARRSDEYGVGTGSISVDMAKVKARKDGIMLADRKGVEDWLEGMDGCTVFRGHARFEDPHTLRVGDEVLHADRIFLNVGGRAVVPDIPGLDDVEYLTNVSILELDTLPHHLVIVGGSYIALEFAQMYRRFGARVTVVERGPRLASREDEDVSAAISEILEAEGIDIVLGADDVRITQARQWTSNSRPRAGADSIRGSHLLLAVGRRPNTDDLGLEARRRADRRTRLHRGRRSAEDQRRPHLGDGRLQRQGRIHPHLLQRFRDRGRQPARRRPAPGERPHPHLRALHRSAAGPRRHDRRRGPRVGPQGAAR